MVLLSQGRASIKSVIFGGMEYGLCIFLLYVVQYWAKGLASSSYPIQSNELKFPDP